MAESDKRIESLEDEVKVLKGEVKRTLVDLRALLMREDSPLIEGARRSSAPARAPAEESPAKKEAAKAPEPPPAVLKVSVAPEPVLVAAPPVAAVPPASPEAVSASGSAATSPQRASEPPQGPGVVQPPGSSSQSVTEVSPANSAQEQAPTHPDLSGRESAPQEREGSPRLIGRSAETEHRRDGRDERAEAGEAHQPAANTRSLASRWRNGDPDFSRGRRRVEEDMDQPRHRQEEEDRPVHGGRNGHDRRGHADTGSRVFEEYWELLDEAVAQPPASGDAGPPLDMNVMANLVYWVSLAKQRLGDQKLKELLELYLQSGHSRPGLRDLLLHLHAIAAPAPAGPPQGNLEWVDLMFQLHGILTGGLPIGRMPPVALTPKPAAAPTETNNGAAGRPGAPKS